MIITAITWVLAIIAGVLLGNLNGLLAKLNWQAYQNRDKD